jgi:hypothetical protein
MVKRHVVVFLLVVSNAQPNAQVVKIDIGVKRLLANGN